MALFVFHVPLKGSFPTLLLGALIYVTATTAYGMLISAFTRTQIAALFGTAILTVLPATHVLRHDGPGLVAHRDRARSWAAVPDDLFPADQRRHLHQGARASPTSLPNLTALAVFIPVLTLLSLLLLRKQER